MSQLLTVDAPRLQVRFGEERNRRLSVYDVGRTLSNLQAFFNVSFWAATDMLPTPVEDLRAYDYRADLRRNLVVGRLTYASPIDLVILFGSLSSVSMAAIGGAIRLKNKWDEHRLNNALTDLKVDAINVLRRSLPEPDPVRPPDEFDELEDGVILELGQSRRKPPARKMDKPRPREITAATEILTNLDVMRVMNTDSDS